MKSIQETTKVSDEVYSRNYESIWWSLFKKLRKYLMKSIQETTKVSDEVYSRKVLCAHIIRFLHFYFKFISSYIYLHTSNLFSFLLTITPVICWSIKIKMVAKSAGIMAANIVHSGFSPNGVTSHSLLGLVGCNKIKKINDNYVGLNEVLSTNTILKLLLTLITLHIIQVLDRIYNVKLPASNLYTLSRPPRDL